MISIKTTPDYWFTIEPYVYINIANKCALLYNTLDRVTIESDKTEVITLMQEILQEENCGVSLLTNEQYQQKEINAFVNELREKYMGDIIDVTLSNGKPVQLLPYVNYPHKREIKYNFHMFEYILDTISKISIHVDHTTDITKLIYFLQSAPDNLTLNIIGGIGEIKKRNELLSFLDMHPSQKNILCSYINIIVLEPAYQNNFSYKVSIDFPVDTQQLNRSMQLLLNQPLPFEYFFEVTSENDCQQVNQLIEKYKIEKYHLNPVYTGENINFFEENVFLTKEDILSNSMSIKDFYINKSININDFGTINIMPNGNVYANVNHPILGNIYTHSLYEIVQNEMERGRSWLRIRNQAPCNTCIYQWLCPSPSNYEIAIGRPNLCHVEQQQI